MNGRADGQLSRRVILACGCIVAYVLSSGPVLAAAFWLREATGWDRFYAVLFVYYPLLILGRQSPVAAYIDWWVKLLHTVGPG